MRGRDGRVAIQMSLVISSSAGVGGSGDSDANLNQTEDQQRKRSRAATRPAEKLPSARPAMKLARTVDAA